MRRQLGVSMLPNLTALSGIKTLKRKVGPFFTNACGEGFSAGKMFMHESGYEAVCLAQRCPFGNTPLHDVGGEEKGIGSRLFGGIGVESHAFEQ